MVANVDAVPSEAIAVIVLPSTLLTYRTSACAMAPSSRPARPMQIHVLGTSLGLDFLLSIPCPSNDVADFIEFSLFGWKSTRPHPSGRPPGLPGLNGGYR